jgi:hypothetical protein
LENEAAGYGRASNRIAKPFRFSEVRSGDLRSVGILTELEAGADQVRAAVAMAPAGELAEAPRRLAELGGRRRARRGRGQLGELVTRLGV